MKAKCTGCGQKTPSESSSGWVSIERIKKVFFFRYKLVRYFLCLECFSDNATYSRTIEKVLK